MATYSLHRLIVGKAIIDKNNSVVLGYLDFLRKCLLSIPLRFIRLLSKSLNIMCCQGVKMVNFRGKC